MIKWYEYFGYMENTEGTHNKYYLIIQYKSVADGIKTIAFWGSKNKGSKINTQIKYEDLYDLIKSKTKKGYSKPIENFDNNNLTSEWLRINLMNFIMDNIIYDLHKSKIMLLLASGSGASTQFKTKALNSLGKQLNRKETDNVSNDLALRK